MSEALPDLEAADLPHLLEQAQGYFPAQPERALLLAREAERRARQAADSSALARSLHLVGRCLLATSQHEAARTELERALALSERTAQGQIQRDLLKTLFFLRDYEHALMIGLEALELSRELIDRRLEALVLNDLGILYGSLDIYEECLAHLQSSLRILEEVGDENLANPLNNIGQVYLQLGKPKEALEFFMAALRALAQSERSEGIILGNIGRAHLALQNTCEALSYLEKSRAYFEARQDTAYLAPALAKIGTVYAERGFYEQALSYYQQSLALLATPEDTFGEETLLAIGRLYLKQGMNRAALAHFKRALKVIGQASVSGAAYGAHLALSEAYEALGEHEQALYHHKRFFELRRRVFDAEADRRAQSLMIQFDVERAKQERELHRLKNIELAGAYARLEQQARELEQLSRQDALTGLANRRHLDEVLGTELERARRYEHELSLAVVDIDDFKRINDNFSHGLGDEVLRVTAGILRAHTRATDVIARYGGEEFMLVFPETPLDKAGLACEKIRLAFENHPWQELHPKLRVTISLGIASSSSTPGLEELLTTADRKLYEAKRLGKNRVCC